MGIFYKAEPEILTEADIAYVFDEIIVEGFRPVEAIKKFFSFIVRKIKEFFNKLFGPAISTPEISAPQITVTTTTLSRPPVPKEKQLAHDRYRVLQKMIESETKELEPPPPTFKAAYSYFDVDDALHEVSNLIAKCLHMFEDQINKTIKVIERQPEGERQSFTFAKKSLHFDDDIRRFKKELSHSLDRFVKQETVSIDVSDVVGDVTIDTSKYFPQTIAYKSRIEKVSTDMVKKCERITESVIKKHPDIFGSEEDIVPLKSHATVFINVIQRLGTSFRHKFGNKHNHLLMETVIQLANYNELKRDHEQDVKRIEEYKQELEEIASKYGHF